MARHPGPPPQAPESVDGYIVHAVSRLDTLAGLAIKYDVQVRPCSPLATQCTASSETTSLAARTLSNIPRARGPERWAPAGCGHKAGERPGLGLLPVRPKEGPHPHRGRRPRPRPRPKVTLASHHANLLALDPIQICISRHIAPFCPPCLAS
jgi:hypothetical protein